MWTNIFLFLWIIGTVKYKSTPIPRDCAKLVQRCPVEKDQWTQKNDLLKCAKYYGYVCLRDATGYLFETCMANFTIRANSSNCPTLFVCQNNKPYLGRDTTYYHCPEDVSGCPPRNHAEYSIHQLYKYPKCIDSRFSSEPGNTSRRSSTSIFKTTMTTLSTDEVNRQDNKHVVFGIVVFAVLFAVFTVVGCIIRYVYSRKKNHEYAKVTYGENKEKTEEHYKDLHNWIQSINESEADRILPLKENGAIEVDRIYVPVVIAEEKETQTKWIANKETMSEITPEEMFYIAPGRPARFIFMLGDAGYGKTVQCQIIAKTWCEAFKAKNPQEVYSNIVTNSEKTKEGKLKEWEKCLKTFEFLFYVPMRDVNNELVSVYDMLFDYYRRFDTSHQHLVDIRAVLRDKKYKCLIILDGLDEWNIPESMKGYLLNRGLPNSDDISNCTILFTMRTWRFLEVDPKCRRGLFYKVIRLHGLHNDSIEELMTNMLCNYFSVDKNSKTLWSKTKI